MVASVRVLDYAEGSQKYLAFRIANAVVQATFSIGAGRRYGDEAWRDDAALHSRACLSITPPVFLTHLIAAKHHCRELTPENEVVWRNPAYRVRIHHLVHEVCLGAAPVRENVIARFEIKGGALEPDDSH
jgi:hypothetical protein